MNSAPSQPHATDTEYQDGIILRVDPGEDGWAVEYRDLDQPDRTSGWSLWCPDHGIEPHPGNHIRVWGQGIGFPFRGIAINGRIVFYRTAAEHEAHQERQQHEREQEQRETFAGQRADFDRRVAALPDVFHARIRGFQRRNSEFGWRFGMYELSCCEDAVRIADTLRTEDAIRTWFSQDWEAQQETVPGLFDGHSGNSFAQATYLARVFLVDPEVIPREHGALCPLVGCGEYGCWSTAQDGGS